MASFTNPIADTSTEVLRIPVPVIISDLAGNSFTLQSGAIPVQQTSASSVTTTLQNAAAANGNGTSMPVLGNASVIFTVNQSSFTGTVNFECTEDNTNWDPLQVQQEGTNTITTTVTGSTTTAIHLYEGSVAGLQSVRARVSGFSAGTVTVTAHAIPQTDAPRVINTNSLPPYPGAATAITASSANQANANAVATLAAVSGKTTYITGFALTASGATAASVVTATVAGVITGTMNFTFVAPAGVTAQATPLVVNFPQPVPASATNTTIVVTLPALGSGNTNATAAAWGFQM
jgi:hypothetical protein